MFIEASQNNKISQGTFTLDKLLVDRIHSLPPALRWYVHGSKTLKESMFKIKVHTSHSLQWKGIHLWWPVVIVSLISSVLDLWLTVWICWHVVVLMGATHLSCQNQWHKHFKMQCNTMFLYKNQQRKAHVFEMFNLIDKGCLRGSCWDCWLIHSYKQIILHQ